MPELPTGPLVCVAWLNALGIAPAATNLPSTAGGFFTVETVGGDIDIDTGQRNPVFDVSGWWYTPNASTPPYGKAASLIERMLERCFIFEQVAVTPTPGSYYSARVSGPHPVSEVRLIREPDTSRAHFSVDLALSWVPIIP